MAKKFYAVVGDNGLAVFNDYYLALEERLNVVRIHIKGFSTEEEAFYYAKCNYNLRQMPKYTFNGQIDDLCMNEIFDYRECYKKNEERGIE